MHHNTTSPQKIRLPWITALRIIAMVSVLVPHLLAYRIDNLAARYLAHYGLNRLHIIQFGGAFGVSLFFITSGYLIMPQIGTRRYYQRFIKQIVLVIAEAFAAMMVCMVLSEAVERALIAINGYESYYVQYSVKDWVMSGLLIRNLLYWPSTEAVLWFLIPFLFFKVLFLIYDAVSAQIANREIKFVYMIFFLFLIGYLPFFPKESAALRNIRERFFYMGIILIGYIFALLHRNLIHRKVFLAMCAVDILLMLLGLEKTVLGIDDGYIVSALYATVIFYVFYKIRDCIPNNRFIQYFDKIGLSFFLLHNCIGFNFIQLIYNGFLNGVHSSKRVYFSLVMSVICMMVVVTVYAHTIQPLVTRGVKRLFRL